MAASEEKGRVVDRESNGGTFFDHDAVKRLGLETEMLAGAVSYTYSVLDAIDEQLTSQSEGRLSELLELANLSAIVGNLFRGGLAKSSDGRFIANGPHKYPDLLSTEDEFGDIEIKVALETNKPKGHLVKPGPHITVRYVLGTTAGEFIRGKENRSNVVWIWEVRVGYLEEDHFNVSNTAGDSGKTAVINKEGMDSLSVSFVDVGKCPHSPRGGLYSFYKSLVPDND